MSISTLTSFKPRRLLADEEPEGYFESDDDFIKNNQDLVIEFLEGLEQANLGVIHT